MHVKDLFQEIVQIQVIDVLQIGHLVLDHVNFFVLIIVMVLETKGFIELHHAQDKLKIINNEKEVRSPHYRPFGKKLLSFFS